MFMTTRLSPAILFLFSIIALLCSCAEKSDHTKQTAPLKDSIQAVDTLHKVSTKSDVLSAVERQYFRKFKNEEDFLIADSVLRFNRMENGAYVNFMNEFIYRRDVADLIGGIYMNYSMTFSPISDKNADPFVNYSFRAGNASAGNGTIVKLGDKIILTQTGCGTSCNTFVKVNGKKVFEKEN
jgi:hypothetical protein